MDDSAPTRREEDCEWEECVITVDAREAQGIRPKIAGLRQPLDPEANPILTLFLRFFPLDTYLEHLADVAHAWEAGPASRHNIPWNKGAFLRFLGVLVHMSCFPLPNIAHHWKFPASFPLSAEKGRKNLKTVLR